MAGQLKETRDRLRMLRTTAKLLEPPMIVLAFVWLVLMVLDMSYGLTGFWQTVILAIWIVFIVEFLLKFVIAPDKSRYILKNWLTALSLFVPALRVLRPLKFFGYARALRGAQVVRVVGSLNRSMRALGRTMGRRGVGYVVAFTTLVAFGGAAGMYAFERGSTNGFNSYAEALWWTAMILTTSGSGYWPETNEGRILGFLLAVYAFSVFGYVAATLASFFVERDAAAPESDTIGREEYEAIMAELRALRSGQEASKAQML